MMRLFLRRYLSIKWFCMHCAADRNVNIQFQKLYSSSDEKASFSLKHYVESQYDERILDEIENIFKRTFAGWKSMH